MKRTLLFFALVSCALGLFAQEALTANIRKNGSQRTASASLDTAASILRDWFKPVEHPDKNFLNKDQPKPFPAPAINNLTHTILHYSKDTYCGHPRMVNFKYFPPNEIIVGHFHAPSAYKVYDDVRHISYQSRSVCLLQRSTDMGKTWPKKNEVILFNNAMPREEKVKLAHSNNPRPERYNMFNRNSAFFF